MSSSASRRNRKRREKENRDQPGGFRRPDPFRFTEPPVPENDPSRVRICPDPPPPPPPPGAESQFATGPDDFETIFQSGTGSRFNSLQDSLRSRLLFPIETKMTIDGLARDFARQLKVSTKLEFWCCGEMARATVQSEIASDQMLVNKMLVAEKAGTAWIDMRRADANALGATIAQAPRVVQGALESTRYGTLYLIDHWQLIKDVCDSGNGIDESLRQSAFNWLGIDEVYRKNSPRVPSDAGALAALAAKEMERHRANLTRVLNDRDQAEQRAAMIGITKTCDPETKRLRANRSRALRRVNWAWNAIEWLRVGIPAAEIIDPETRKPMNPNKTYTTAGREGPSRRPEPPPPPPPPTSADAEPSAPEAPVPPFADGTPEEVRQTFTVVAEAYRRHRAQSKKATPPSDQPPGDPGPPTA